MVPKKWGHEGEALAQPAAPEYVVVQSVPMVLKKLPRRRSSSWVQPVASQSTGSTSANGYPRSWSRGWSAGSELSASPEYTDRSVLTVPKKLVTKAAVNLLIQSTAHQSTAHKKLAMRGEVLVQPARDTGPPQCYSVPRSWPWRSAVQPANPDYTGKLAKGTQESGHEGEALVQLYKSSTQQIGSYGTQESGHGEAASNPRILSTLQLLEVSQWLWNALLIEAITRW